MKLLTVTPYYHPRIGGLEIYARQFGVALRDLFGWEVVIVTSHEGSRKDADDYIDDMPVFRLGTWARLSNTPLSPSWPAKIRRVIKSERPDLVLAHTPVPAMADAAALAAGRTPLVIAYHAATLFKTDTPLFNALALAYGGYQRITLSRADHILAVSDYVRLRLPASVRGKSSVLPNSVWEKEIVRREQPRDASFLWVGSLDRTHSWKGLDLVLRAMACHREMFGSPAELSVLGDGNHRGYYEATARELGLGGAVRFRGWQVGVEKEAAFAAATAVVVYPTSSNDAFPTVMLEAWARGVPVVAASIGALPTLLSDRRDGFLVPPHDPAALGRVLQEVAAMSAGQRAAIADAATARLIGSYTWERQAREFASLAGRLTGGG